MHIKQRNKPKEKQKKIDSTTEYETQICAEVS